MRVWGLEFRVSGLGFSGTEGGRAFPVCDAGFGPQKVLLASLRLSVGLRGFLTKPVNRKGPSSLYGG